MVSYHKAEIRNSRKQTFCPDVQLSGQKREKVTVAKEKAALERPKGKHPLGREGRCCSNSVSKEGVALCKAKLCGWGRGLDGILRRNSWL